MYTKLSSSGTMASTSRIGARHTANAAVFLFLSGSQAMIPFIPLHALSLGADPAAIGIILGGYHLLPLLLAIPLGGVIQRWGPARSLFLASLSGAGAALFMVQGGLLYLVVGLLVFGVASLTIVIAGQVETLVTVPEADWDHAIGMFAFSTSLGLIAGPLIGGFLSKLGGVRLTFYGTIALALAAALVMLRAATLPRAKIVFPAPPSLAGVVTTLGRQSALTTVLLCSLSSEFALSFWNAFFPLLLAGKGLPPQVIGLFFSLRGVATASIRPLLGVITRHITRDTALVVSMATMAVTLAAMPVLDTPARLSLAVVLFGLAAGFIFPLTLALVSVGLTSESVGTGVGIRQFVTRVGQLLGPLVLGMLTQAAGLQAAFVASAVVISGSAAVFARYRPRGP